MEGPDTVTTSREDRTFSIDDGIAVTPSLLSSSSPTTRMGRPPSPLVRLRDVAPALAAETIWYRTRIWTASTFSQGWVQQDGEHPGVVWQMMFNVETKTFEIVRDDERRTFRMEFDDEVALDGTIWMVIGDDEQIWNVDRAAGKTLELERRASSNTRSAQPPPAGEVRLKLEPLSTAPFVVLADALNLREAPDRTAKTIGTLSHGTPVMVWARSGRQIQIGPVPGEWILVQHQDRIGWAFSPYVGQRLSPLDPDRPDVYVVPTRTKGAPIAASVKDGEARCQVDGISQYVLREPGIVSAHVMLARLNEDGILDPSCIFKRTDSTLICPVLSSGEQWTPTNCVQWDVSTLPGISGKDIDGDGVRDLVLRGEVTRTFPYVAERNQYQSPEVSP